MTTTLSPTGLIVPNADGSDLCDLVTFLTTNFGILNSMKVLGTTQIRNAAAYTASAKVQPVQGALNDLDALVSPGGIIFFPAGTYVITAPLTSVHGNVTLVGAPGAILRIVNSTDGALWTNLTSANPPGANSTSPASLLHFSNVNNIRIYGLEIDGDLTAITQTNGLQFTGCSALRIQRCKVSSFMGAGILTEAGVAHSDLLWIEDCQIADCEANALDLKGCDRLWVKDNVVSHSTATLPLTAQLPYGYGIIAEANNTTAEGSVSISGNTVTTPRNHGIYISASATSNHTVTVSDNVVDTPSLVTGQTARGEGIVVAATGGRYRIAGNSVQYPQGHGIELVGEQEYAIVTGNRILMSGASYGNGINVSDCDNIIVSRNHVMQTGSAIGQSGDGINRTGISVVNAGLDDSTSGVISDNQISNFGAGYAGFYTAIDLANATSFRVAGNRIVNPYGIGINDTNVTGVNIITQNMITTASGIASFVAIINSAPAGIYVANSTNKVNSASQMFSVPGLVASAQKFSNWEPSAGLDDIIQVANASGAAILQIDNTGLIKQALTLRQRHLTPSQLIPDGTNATGPALQGIQTLYQPVLNFSAITSAKACIVIPLIMAQPSTNMTVELFCQASDAAAGTVGLDISYAFQPYSGAWSGASPTPVVGTPVANGPGGLGAVITAQGLAYTSVPTVTLTGTAGSGASATAVMNAAGTGVASLNVVPGSGYTAASALVWSGGGGGSGAAGIAWLAPPLVKQSFTIPVLSGFAPVQFLYLIISYSSTATYIYHIYLANGTLSYRAILGGYGGY